MMEELTFEQAIEQLDEIVRRMESGNTPLEETLRDYERAVGLVRHCTELLATAERKMTILTEEDKANGNATTA